jgi:hypothetical protein
MPSIPKNKQSYKYNHLCDFESQITTGITGGVSRPVDALVMRFVDSRFN